ncbi:MAG: hypothetical protein ACLQPN_11975, partial [Bryobacteraceae bacterium]
MGYCLSLLQSLKADSEVNFGEVALPQRRTKKKQAVYQGTASAQYCSLKQGDADCEVDTLRLVAS